MFKIIYNPLNSIRIKVGVSKMALNSEEDCVCGLKDCFNVSVDFISS